ncbi:MAG: L-threonylcarbamoyladenylate synthase [Planctomycetota bacterium]|nr:L-threonylcarbamoyladenylate synthase [Planctomycetota bacterium]
MTLHSSPAREEITRAAAILRAGGIGGIPTETVYGLGADAFQPQALARVFDVKGRPHFDPLIVHLADIGWIDRVAREFPANARRLAERFWPGPLTLVVPKLPTVPDLATAGLETVAVRVPDHPVAHALIEEAATPIAAPSANLFGRISPTTAQHVVDQLGDKIDFVLDGGPCRVGVESTVILVQHNRLALLRPGGLTVEEVEACLGAVDWFDPVETAASRAGMVAPGMLPQHYAPRTPLTVVPEGEATGTATRWMKEQPNLQVGILALRTSSDAPTPYIEVLSSDGDLREAAAGFFASLRRLDALALDRIVAERFPERGLGRALNDRLTRAAG